MSEAVADQLAELQRQVARLEEEALRSAELQRQAEKQRSTRAAHVEERLSTLDGQSRELRDRLLDLEARASAAPRSGDAAEPEVERHDDVQQFASVETEHRTTQLEGLLVELAARVEQLDSAHGALVHASQAVASDGRLHELDRQVQALSARVEALPRPEPLGGRSPELAGEPSEAHQVEALAAEVRQLREQRAGEAAARALAAAEEASARTAQVENHIIVLEQSLQDLRTGVQALESSASAQALASLSQNITVDLDSRNESRLTAIWQELTSHADKAAARANQVEQDIYRRMEALEHGAMEQDRAIAEQARKKAVPDTAARLAPAHPGCSKLIDSLTWRISWLEWSISGDKRSFSRPISEKAAMPWAPSELIHAPRTEDSELLIRDASGQLRPRRKARALMASRSEASGEGFAAAVEVRGTADRSFQPLRTTKSTGRLLPLRPTEQ